MNLEQRLETHLNIHRTVDGDRDPTLVGVRRGLEKGVIRQLETAFTNEFPDEFVGITPFGSRTKEYAVREHSDYDMFVTYDPGEGGNIFVNTFMARSIIQRVNAYLEDRKAVNGILSKITVMPVNVNPEEVAEIFRTSYNKTKGHKRLAVICHAVYGQSSGRRIEKYRVDIGQMVQRLLGSDPSREQQLIRTISRRIARSELHAASFAKLTQRRPDLVSTRSNLLNARQALWVHRLAKYL
ncbi:MAG: hypothetical protein HY978_00800 [Candidatus Liptonbacteria bacterium]|nr:hypothetical protein [Candidatus Liptonbacteria bacterium]